MSRKATLDALFAAKPGSARAPEVKSAVPEPERAESDRASLGTKSLGAPNAPAAPAEAVERVRSGAIGAMGASLQQLKASAREAEDLRQAVASGERIVQLDPAMVDSAPVADRFRQVDDPTIAALAESIRESGQQVPILVRPHPVAPGRWQAAYGHRRVAACRLAGLPVRAQVRALTDAELAVAQGKENLDRRDLSFIEKAFFAAGLLAAGVERTVIAQALGADRADLSRYLALARAVPEALARAIGPAPKTGRARWQELAEVLAARPPDARPVADLIAHWPLLDAWRQADSDGRFRLALARLAAAGGAAQADAQPADTLLADAAGQPIATIRGEGRRRRLDFNEALAPGFAAHVAAALPALYRNWLDAGSGPSTRKE